MERQRGRFGKEYKEVSFGHVKFEMTMSYPSKNVKSAVG